MIKDCNNCKFEDYCLAVEPCKSCVLADEPDNYWEAKDNAENTNK